MVLCCITLCCVVLFCDNYDFVKYCALRMNYNVFLFRIKGTLSLHSCVVVVFCVGCVVL